MIALRSLKDTFYRTRKMNVNFCGRRHLKYHTRNEHYMRLIQKHSELIKLFHVDY